jgi:sugar O-acyltransferase (sialic acid O-acetyltransferase NeuD family)
MQFNIVTAPHINVNDLEMKLVKWHVQPWQQIKKDELLCEVESTKAIVSVESNFNGYIYPIADESRYITVGAPLAYIFPENDPAQLKLISPVVDEKDDVIVTKKARALMEEHGLSTENFPNFPMINAETVVAQIRKMEPVEFAADEERYEVALQAVQVTDKSVVVYGVERNLALLAIDAFAASDQYEPAVYANSSEGAEDFYNISVMHQDALGKLRDRGVQYAFIGGANQEDNEKIEEECVRLGFEIVSAVHPSAVVSSFVNLGRGVFIGAGAVIGPDVTIADFSRILSGATVAHHSSIGKYVQISDGAHLGGNVHVGDRSVIGIGVNVNKWINIGQNASIVSGAVVTDHVPDNSIFRIDGQIRNAL